MTRGEIWRADFGIPFGSGPGYKRPVLIVQDVSFNSSSIKTIVIAPFSTNLILADAPGNILLEKISKIEKRLFADIEDCLLIVLGIRKLI
jgi:mRNA interferase MazF